MKRAKILIKNKFSKSLSEHKSQESIWMMRGLKILFLKSEYVDFLNKEFVNLIDSKCKLFCSKTSDIGHSIELQLKLSNYCHEYIIYLNQILVASEMDDEQTLTFIGKSLYKKQAKIMRSLYGQIESNEHKESSNSIMKTDALAYECIRAVQFYHESQLFFFTKFKIAQVELNEIDMISQKLTEAHFRLELNYFNLALDQALKINIYDSQTKAMTLVGDSFFIVNKIMR
ncbi:MAG: hypothetical protein MHPSP_001786 [Paramarteilia canceri]